MPKSTAHMFSRLLAILLVVSLMTAPLPLSATPQPVPEAPATVAGKQAERKAALAELEYMREELKERVSEYVSLGRRIARVQSEIIEVQADLDEVNGEVIVKERAVRERVVQMYRGDRAGLLEALLDARSIQDFMARAHYLIIISQRDSRTLNELRLARTESMWLQQTLLERADTLMAMQAEADTRREAIEADITSQEERAQELGEDIALLMRPAPRPQTASGGEQQGEFDPYAVMSEAVFRNTASMTEADIQAFLERQPGTLKHYRAPDHSGEMKTAAQMISEAAATWNINPQVILVKLQKEQSLLARTNPTQSNYDWAMGCGKMDGSTLYKYQGFGNQVWYGAASLNNNAERWKPGASLKITGNDIVPANSATYSLYKYTPHLGGTMSFWMLYWRYFGDPLAS
jgi:peptidoglycan hydrolase CwlO-like protein